MLEVRAVKGAQRKAIEHLLPIALLLFVLGGRLEADAQIGARRAWWELDDDGAVVGV